MSANIQFFTDVKNIGAYNFTEAEFVSNTKVTFLREEGNVRLSLTLDLQDYLPVVLDEYNYDHILDNRDDEERLAETIRSLGLVKDPDLINRIDASEGYYSSYIMELAKMFLDQLLEDDSLANDIKEEVFVEIYL